MALSVAPLDLAPLVHPSARALAPWELEIPHLWAHPALAHVPLVPLDRVCQAQRAQLWELLSVGLSDPVPSEPLRLLPHLLPLIMEISLHLKGLVHLLQLVWEPRLRLECLQPPLDLLVPLTPQFHPPIPLPDSLIPHVRLV